LYGLSLFRKECYNPKIKAEKRKDSFMKHYTNSNEKNLMELSSNLTLKRHIIKSSGIFSGKPYG